MPIAQVNPSIVRARSAGQPRRGFTLLEAAMSTIIIGVGVLAVVEAQQSFLERNNWSSGGATAQYLAAEIREMTEHFSRHDRQSGGLYFIDEADPTTLRGWGTEADETAAEDLDDIDDLDGLVFGDATEFPDGFFMTRRFAGPVNAFTQVISNTLYNGVTETFIPEGSDDPIEVALRGWTQIIQVDKVNPADATIAVANNARTMDGADIMRDVDRYPLRVTVTVLRQIDPTEPVEVMTSLTWVVMP